MGKQDLLQPQDFLREQQQEQLITTQLLLLLQRDIQQLQAAATLLLEEELPQAHQQEQPLLEADTYLGEQALDQLPLMKYNFTQQQIQLGQIEAGLILYCQFLATKHIISLLHQMDMPLQITM